MSIIYDALKRVEDKTAKDTKSNLGSSKADKSKFPWKAFLFFVLISLGLGGLLIVNLRVRTGASTPKELIIPEKKSAPPKEVSGLSLKGIFFSDGEYIALINDQMVKVGDFIGEAELIRIEPDGVEIKIGDSTLKLSYP